MRRSTTALLILAVAVTAVALVLRSGTGAPEAADTTTASNVVSTTDTTPTTSAQRDDTTTTTLPPTTATMPVGPGSTLPAGVTACDLYPSIDAVGTVASDELVEASGLAASRTTPDVLWSHNDSRGEPALYAFDRSGADLGGFTVPDAFSIDWEDMAAGPAPDGQGAYLYVGDMGDNFGIRDGVIYVWRVPDLAPSSMDGAFPESVAIVLQMPGGAQDAEALFIDPVEPALYVVTKSRTEATVLKGPMTSTDEPAPMEAVATVFLDAEVSGADITVDGSIIALRGYRTVWMWSRTAGQTIAEALAASPCEAPSAEERQGEAIAFDTASNYYTVSEGSHPTVFEAEVRVP
jgi:hypothetical protein